MSDAGASPTAGAQVDRQNPWPGLASFSEPDSPYFFGRHREAEELERRIRRDVATVLFGGSGLGKTSLIRAGLFPALRRADFFPVWIRLDHGVGAADPVEQIKAVVRDSADAAGVDVELAGCDWNSATLWEVFHRVEFWSATNRLLIPVLVLDQFEELFTIGRGRPDTADLVRELEDLIENQIPELLRGRLDASGESLEFSFERRDFRVLVSLREDFLPLLEQLTESIPTFRRNRMRLGPMASEQAHEAVLGPGAGLVDAAVGTEIVRFVADTDEHPVRRIGSSVDGLGQEVEPALLSLVCHELNAKRLAAGRQRITTDLLSESKVGILSDFYARCVDDLPAGVRVFIEEHLLTRTGFRNSVAVEDAVGIHGIAPEHIAVLVDRRLLRVEDRLGARRVELTHDVLTRTIRKSRDRRRVEEEERRRGARRLRLLGWVAGGLAVFCLLLLVGVGVAGLMYLRVEQASEEATRRRAEIDALHQMMLFDLRQRLEPIGQLGIVEELALKVLASTESEDVDQLPDDLVRTRLVALINLGDVEMARGELTTAMSTFEQALGLARQLTASDPDNMLWLHDLSIAHQRMGQVEFQQGRIEAALESLAEVEQITRRLVEVWPQDLERRRELAFNLVFRGNLERARWRLGRADEAFRSALEIMTGLVQRSPDNAAWQRDVAAIHENIGGIEEERGDVDNALTTFLAAVEIRERLSEAEPSLLQLQGELAASRLAVGSAQLAAGEIGGAEASIERGLAVFEQLSGEHPERADWASGLANAIGLEALLRRSRGDLTDALNLYRERQAILDELADRDDSLVGFRLTAAATRLSIGDVYMGRRDWTAAEATYREALGIATAVASLDASMVDAARLVAASEQRVGDALLAAGGAEQAVDMYRMATGGVRRLRASAPEETQHALDVADNLDRLSDALYRLGDVDEGRRSWREAVELVTGLETAGHDTADSHTLAGQLGSMTLCRLFRKPAAVMTTLGVDRMAVSGGGPKTRAAIVGARARLELLAGAPKRAIDLSRRALAEDPNQVWLRLTLAHGLLLDGQQDLARRIYLSNAARPVTDTLIFREAVVDDFRELAAAGLRIPEMDDVERSLRR